MAIENINTEIEKILAECISNPNHILYLLEKMYKLLIEAEVKIKLNASKNEHSKERTGYRSRQLHTRLGTIELEIPKVRKGGYIPFFISSPKRSEIALMSVIQSAYIRLPRV